MGIDSGKITGSQFMFSVFCFIHSSFLLTSLLASLVQQDSWLAVLLGYLFALPMLGVCLALMRRFPGLNLVQINDRVFGKAIGRLVSGLYIYFFFTLVSLNLRDMGYFVQQTIMPKTPLYVTLALFALVCAWSARNGAEVVARYSVVFSATALIVVLVAILLNLSAMDPLNFLPIFRQPAKNYLQGGHIMATIPFGEVVAFLMIAPTVEGQPRRTRQLFFYGLSLGAGVLLIINLRDTALLGNTLALFSLPPFEAYRITAITPVLSRMEILFAIAFVILLFFKIQFLLYATIAAIGQAAGLKSFKYLALGTAGIAVIYALNVYTSTLQHTQSATRHAPFVWLLFEFLLPLITLVTAAVRGRAPGPVKEAAAE